MANVGAGPGDGLSPAKAQLGADAIASHLKGLKLKGVVNDEVGPGDGLSYSKAIWWADDVASLVTSGVKGLLGECLGPSQPEIIKGSLERPCSWARSAYDNGRNCEAEFLKLREKEDNWKQQMASSHSVTDRALIEEELRYESALIQWGVRASGFSSPVSLPFGRTPEGEYYDHSRVLCEEIQEDTPLSMLKTIENGGGSGDLVEVNLVNNKAKEWERGLILTESQEVRGERENRWEESNLAKFSQFLGFSTEGLEKEILNFLAKIRKRRERIYSRGALEKTKFERELKRLECSINYEGGSK